MPCSTVAVQRSSALSRVFLLKDVYTTTASTTRVISEWWLESPFEFEFDIPQLTPRVRFLQPSAGSTISQLLHSCHSPHVTVV